MHFKDELRGLIEDAKTASSLSSDNALGKLLGITSQSISNAKSNSGANASKMLSKPLIEELMGLAKYDSTQRAEFIESWLTWKIERTHDGGMGKFLLAQLKSALDKKEFQKILKKSAELRHGADVTGRGSRKE